MRVRRQTGDNRQIQVKAVNQPLNGRSRLVCQRADQRGARVLSRRLQRVGFKHFRRIRNAKSTLAHPHISRNTRTKHRPNRYDSHLRGQARRGQRQKAAKRCKNHQRTCDLVPAALMPDVAFVELPPQNGDLSRTRTRPPACTTECAADMPANPPPNTMTWADIAGKGDEGTDQMGTDSVSTPHRQSRKLACR
jgi:hypothetical protein